MRPHPAIRRAPSRRGIHPALKSFADDCRDAVLRMLAYVGVLALIGLVVFYAANPLTDAALRAVAAPETGSGWSQATHSHPAFALSQLDWPGKSETYEIFRHPEGGRKDVLRVAAPGEPAVAEVEIYRIGAEASGLPEAELAARMDPGGTAAIQNAGLVETKFGPVALLSLTGGAGPGGCFGFLKSIEPAGVRLSGFSCRGDNGPQRRAAVGCLLDRVVLLTAGGDGAIAGAFAQAELRRANCNSNRLPATAAADWVTGMQDPHLRGGL
jgi:hypothetical protein